MSLKSPKIKFCCSSSKEEILKVVIGCQFEGNPYKLAICENLRCYTTMRSYLLGKCTCVFCQKPIAVDFITLSRRKEGEWLKSWATCGKECYDLMKAIKKNAKHSPDNAQFCDGCNKFCINKSKLLCCGKCFAVRSCNKQCQLIHWEKGHKTVCKRGNKKTKKEKERRKFLKRLSGFPVCHKDGKYQHIPKENVM